MYSKENVIGAVFNRWTVISSVNGKFVCQCKCGRITLMPLSLINSPRRSKGCRKCSFKRIFIGFNKAKKVNFLVDWGKIQ